MVIDFQQKASFSDVVCIRGNYWFSTKRPCEFHDNTLLCISIKLPCQLHDISFYALDVIRVRWSVGQLKLTHDIINALVNDNLA